MLEAFACVEWSADFSRLAVLFLIYPPQKKKKIPDVTCQVNRHADEARGLFRVTDS